MPYNFKRCLKSCAKWFFIRFYPLLKNLAVNPKDQNIRSQIHADAAILIMRNGNHYTTHSIDSRISQALRIIKEGDENKVFNRVDR